jgi:hypothetical protein
MPIRTRICFAGSAALAWRTSPGHHAGINCQGALVLDFGGGGDSSAISALSSGLVALLSAGKPDAPAALIDRGIIDADQEVHLTLLLGESPSEAHRTQLDAMSSGKRLAAAQATMVRIIAAVCRQRPTMIRIEDIHWADEPTLSIIEALTLQAEKLPLILVVTTRIEGNPLARNTELDRLFTAMTLDQLDPDAAADLAARYDDLDSEQVAACLARAGAPLFLDQLLRNARESRSDSLPGNLQSAVAARMDSLPAVDRRALQVASILGQRFDLDTLRHLLENEHYSCTALLNNGLLRPSGKMLLFTHALVREGVLLSLLRTDRRALHRRADIVAHLAGFVLYDMARFDQAREVLTVGLEMARAIGASRFEGWSLNFLAKIAHQEGKANEATEHAEAALVIARGPGAGFMGAMAYGAAALCASTDDAVRAMLDESMALLADGAVSHNHFHFHRDAMDTALARGLWDLALKHADALEAYTSGEPAAWSDFFTQRTRLIARVGQDEQVTGDTAQLEALHKTARGAGLLLAAGQLPATI